MNLYYANLELAQAFHPLLGTFEVILRNQIHYALAAHFNDKEWIINQKNGFMQDRRLGTRFWLKSEVVETIYMLVSSCILFPKLFYIPLVYAHR